MTTTLVERCVHQIFDEGVHVLFKEQWEACKKCAYDPENNKKCPGYSPTAHYVSNNSPSLVSSTSPNLNGARV